jgi:UrcA family protein
MKESKIMRRLFATVAIIALSVPAIVSASPGGELQGKAVKVTYADLNLEKEAGARVLYRRLQKASKEVCGVESLKNAVSLAIHVEMKSCYNRSLAAAVEEIDSEELTRIHES